jgi:hypothetical protein
MNFDSMWTVKHGHTDIVFWAIALPLMAIVIPLFLWVDIKQGLHDVKKRMIARSTAMASICINSDDRSHLRCHLGSEEEAMITLRVHLILGPHFLSSSIFVGIFFFRIGIIRHNILTGIRLFCEGIRLFCEVSSAQEFPE